MFICLFIYSFVRLFVCLFVVFGFVMWWVCKEMYVLQPYRAQTWRVGPPMPDVEVDVACDFAWTLYGDTHIIVVGK